VKPEPIYQQIGRLIRSLRRGADKAQEELASRLGISRATLASIETGRQRILIHQLYAVARALDVKVSELLPSPADDRTAPSWDTFTFDGDLNTQQKKQVASLIGQVEAPTIQQKKETHAKSPTTRRNPGRSRTKTPR
jgi:transcriptional regulator with XRE-family HTH domain